jgi:hypothetical protein
MTTIKTLTRQNYEKNPKSPSEIIFYKDETDLVEIIALHLAKSFKDSIEITEKFLSLPNNVDIYEVETDKKILYIIKSN